MAERTAAFQGRRRTAKGLLLGVTASGALAVATIGSAGSAHASCVSFSGINSGHGCTSTIGNVAVGVGSGTQASATGLLNTSIAVGQYATANSGGVGNLALTVGNYATAEDGQNYGSAAAGIGNSAISIGDGSAAVAGGVLTSATALGKNTTAVSAGYFSRALAINTSGKKPTDPAHNCGTVGLTCAIATGTLGSAVAIGDGSQAQSLGGTFDIGNTAVTLGNNSTSTAGKTGGSFKLAAAIGNGKTADNGINNVKPASAVNNVKPATAVNNKTSLAARR